MRDAQWFSWIFHCHVWLVEGMLEESQQVVGMPHTVTNMQTWWTTSRYCFPPSGRTWQSPETKMLYPSVSLHAKTHPTTYPSQRRNHLISMVAQAQAVSIALVHILPGLRKLKTWRLHGDLSMKHGELMGFTGICTHIYIYIYKHIYIYGYTWMCGTHLDFVNWKPS